MPRKPPDVTNLAPTRELELMLAEERASHERAMAKVLLMRRALGLARARIEELTPATECICDEAHCPDSVDCNLAEYLSSESYGGPCPCTKCPACLARWLRAEIDHAVGQYCEEDHVSRDRRLEAVASAASHLRGAIVTTDAGAEWMYGPGDQLARIREMDEALDSLDR